MAENVKFELMKSYSLETYVPSILKTEFNKITVLMLMTSKGAQQQGADVQALHEQIYPYLPSGSAPRNFEKLRYLLVRTTANVERVIAIEWINPNTVKELTSGPANFVIDDVSPEDFGRIREILAQNNYKVLSAEHID